MFAFLSYKTQIVIRIYVSQQYPKVFKLICSCQYVNSTNLIWYFCLNFQLLICNLTKFTHNNSQQENLALVILINVQNLQRALSVVHSSTHTLKFLSINTVLSKGCAAHKLQYSLAISKIKSPQMPRHSVICVFLHSFWVSTLVIYD